MPILFMILLGIVVICIYHLQQESHNNSIYNQIESLGGKVINIDRRSFWDSIGPFHVIGKGRTIYRIEYEINNEPKEGWVRFGGLFGPDWRL